MNVVATVATVVIGKEAIEHYKISNTLILVVADASDMLFLSVISQSDCRQHTAVVRFRDF